MDPYNDPTLEFLKVCAAEISEVFHYWDSLRNGRRMPARSDMDPLDIPRLLRNIQLIDVSLEPLEFYYRLIGTRLVERLGTDLTGKKVNDVDAILSDYQDVVAKRTHKYSKTQFMDAQESVKFEEVIILPFSDNGKTVNIIMVCII